MRKHFIKKTFSFILCAALVSGSIMVPEKTYAQDSADTTGWRDTIALDFGINGDGSDLDSTMKFNEVEYIPEISAEDCAAILKEGHGNYLYETTTVKDIYGSDASDSQHIGFDKTVPAAKTTEGGNYFKDWVFSPDGEEYSFSADLPVGQYYVYVYTGNKTKAYGNTTIVNFDNEFINETPLRYDQTSSESRQFYGNDDNKANPYCVYVVDVKDNGAGYGTLTAHFSDDTVGNESYAGSHQISIGAALDDIAADVPAEDGTTPGKALGIETFDFYDGTDNAIDSSAIKDSIVTARLNGIEIIPVSNPVHATDIKTPESMILDKGQTAELEVTGSVSSITDRISYMSSNPQVADIDMYSGKITANETGTAKLYAYNAYLNEFSVTDVSVIPERVVSLDKTTVDFVLDDNSTTTAELTASFNAAAEDVIEWSSSDDNIVSIGEAAFTAGETATSKITITAKSAGTATITAKRKDIDNTATCTVNVKMPVSGLEIVDVKNNTPIDNITISAGDTTDIKAIISPENATVKDVTFSSSDFNIAAVSPQGDIATIKGISAGEAVITVTSKDNPDIKDTLKVTVTKAADSSNTTSPNQNNSGNTDNSTPGIGNGDSGADSKAAVSLSGKKASSLKVKKSVTFKAKAPGSKVKSVKVKIKSGKKLIKIKKSAKKVKITALKKGTAKLVITVKAASGASKKFKRTIKIK